MSPLADTDHVEFEVRMSQRTNGTSNIRE